MPNYQRHDSRRADELRPVKLQKGIAPHAAGSVLISMGQTQVICAACLEKKVPGWMLAQGKEGGWITAEYSMLPYSTLDRKQREVAKGKPEGRTVEIQRLIGRAMRAVADLSKLPGYSLWLDCDVLQADGGTRTASITGGYIAAQLAVQKALDAGDLAESPFRDSVSAISVGLVEDTPLLDLCYVEDRDAQVDANVVITGSGQFVELQSSGEEATFSEDQLQELIKLARKGTTELTELQRACLNTEPSA